jgi:hypothetical protein
VPFLLDARCYRNGRTHICQQETDLREVMAQIPVATAETATCSSQVSESQFEIVTVLN